MKQKAKHLSFSLLNKIKNEKVFISGVLGVIDPRKKFHRENSSEVRKMLGCSNKKYENFDFIRRRLWHCFKRNKWSVLLGAGIAPF